MKKRMKRVILFVSGGIIGTCVLFVFLNATNLFGRYTIQDGIGSIVGYIILWMAALLALIILIPVITSKVYRHLDRKSADKSQNK